MPVLETRKKIAVDIDEVLFPMVSDLIEYVDREHKVKLTHEEFVKYDIRDIWKGGPIKASEIFEGYKKQAKPEVVPVKGAKEALDKLSEKYEVIVMTSRDVQVEAKTKEWIYRHFPDLFKEVHLLGNKVESSVYRPKAEACKELGVFCLIDDSLANVIETHAIGIKTILFGDYPWNQTNKLPAGVLRVKGWQEVLEYLDGSR